MLALGLLGALVTGASVAGAVWAAEPKRHVEILAGETGEGRLTGSADERRVADYLAGQLEALGAEPLPGREGLLWPFAAEVAGSDVTGSAVTGRNVVGYLHSESAGRGDKPWVVLSAHYDHLGRGEIPGSLAGGDSGREIHPGADDNASGVAALLAAAERLAGMELDRHVVLALWSGSELGGVGSRAFLEDPAVKPEEIAAHVSLHMVGRMRDYGLLVQSVGTSPVWPKLIEQVNVPLGFNVQTEAGAREPGDIQVFVEAGVPTVELSTGGHADYHRPSDRPETLNYEDLGDVARFAALLVSKVASLEEAPSFVEAELESREPSVAGGARPFTGTIPDYAGEGEGLKLSGVVPGGPAEAAGLLGGDVIVELGGVAVGDVYDYLRALEGAEIGVPMRVVFLRSGERLETVITPTARE